MATYDNVVYKRFNGSTWDIFNFSTTAESVVGLPALLNTKVDKVAGKGLSTNDYTTTEKNKLAGIASGAEVNVQSNWNATSGDALILNKPTIPTSVSQLNNDSGYITGYTETDPIFTAWNKSTGISITKSQVSDLIEATQSLSGLMSATDKTRLDVLHSLLEEDTANNVVDSINEVLAIFNNYPEGADLVTALANKVDKVSGMGLSSNDFTTTEKNKLSGIQAGAQVNVGTNLSQGARNTTTLRIDSSTGNNLTLPAVTTSLAGLMTSTDKTKLNGIATGATANTGTVTNVSAGTTQVSGLTLSVATGSTTPVITTSISNAANFRTAIGAAASSHNHSIAQVTGLQGALNDKANDADVVKSFGNQTIDGNKMFTGLNEFDHPPYLNEDATDPDQAVRLGYVDKHDRVKLLRARSGTDGTDPLTVYNSAEVANVGSQLERGDTIMFEVHNASTITAATPKILTATVSSTANSTSAARSITFTTWTGSEMKVYSLSVARNTAGQLLFDSRNVMTMSKSGTDMTITNASWVPYIGRIWKVEGSVI